MNNRQRALLSVNHQTTDRVALNLNQLDDLEYWLGFFKASNEWEIREELDLDFRKPRHETVYAEGIKNLSGIESVSGDPNVKRPFAQSDDIKMIDNYAWPNPFHIYNYNKIDNIMKGFGDRNSNILTLGWAPLLCTIFDLFGIEKALMRFYDTPKIIEACIERIEYIVLTSMKLILEKTSDKADFFYTGDDFAGQNGLLISPDMWRKYLKPFYKKVCDLIKTYGLKVWFHACGQFVDVMPDLIDIGVDVWETVQVHLNGNEPKMLKREFGQFITFYGGISTQTTLPYGSCEDVRREVRERIKVLGKNGGYICGPDHSVQKNIPCENIVALFDEAKKCTL